MPGYVWVCVCYVWLNINVVHLAKHISPETLSHDKINITYVLYTFACLRAQTCRAYATGGPTHTHTLASTCVLACVHAPQQRSMCVHVISDEVRQEMVRRAYAASIIYRFIRTAFTPLRSTRYSVIKLENYFSH